MVHYTQVGSSRLFQKISIEIIIITIVIIVRKIAIAIDKKSKEPKVRDFFVSHKEGRKRLVVQVESVGGTDYNWFFNQVRTANFTNIIC